MAFFKFRKSGDEASATSTPPVSIEAMRTRAKHRLIGAAVLVLIGVVGFPLLFDKQPRPISVDTPIEIPDKSKAKPLTVPVPQPAATPITPAATSVSPATPAAEAPPPTDKVKPAETAKAIEKPVENVADKPVAAKPAVDDGDKAQALLEGKAPAKAADAGAGRFVVQVGAYADATRAREVRLKVEHAGLKTYTQAVETKDGHRIRVRVGPFADKAEADKAADKIKKLGLPAGILNL